MFSLLPWRQNRSQELAQSDNLSVFDRWHNEMDTLFNRFFHNWMTPWEEERQTAWGFDVNYENDQILVKAELPGFESDELDVQLQGQQLIIKANKKQEEKSEEGNQNYSYRSAVVHRSVTLPEGTDPEKIEANYRNGILEIRIPWAQKEIGHRIEVKS